MEFSFDEVVRIMKEQRTQAAIKDAEGEVEEQAASARKLAQNIFQRDWQKAAMGPISTAIARFLGNLSAAHAEENIGKVVTLVHDFNEGAMSKHSFTMIDRAAIREAMENAGEDPAELTFRKGEILMPEDTYARIKAKLTP